MGCYNSCMNDNSIPVNDEVDILKPTQQHKPSRAGFVARSMKGYQARRNINVETKTSPRGDSPLVVNKSSQNLLDGSTYIGEWKGQMRHGNGKAQNSDGSIYEG